MQKLVLQAIFSDKVPYADEIQHEVRALFLEVPIILQNKTMRIRFILVPEHGSSRTVLVVRLETCGIYKQITDKSQKKLCNDRTYKYELWFRL